jgi:TonB family protein
MAAIKPNIVVVDPVPKDARAEVEITTEPNGRIAGHSLLKASSVQAWDEAVMKAVAMTERLPLAPDGTIPPRMHVIFRLDAP